MAKRETSNKENKLEKEVKALANVLEKGGMQVRREKLSRGPAYRVKSGDCYFAGYNVVFVDKRLPLTQQLSVVIDYLVDLKIPLPENDALELSSSTQALLQAKLSSLAA